MLVFPQMSAVAFSVFQLDHPCFTFPAFSLFFFFFYSTHPGPNLILQLVFSPLSFVPDGTMVNSPVPNFYIGPQVLKVVVLVLNCAHSS